MDSGEFSAQDLVALRKAHANKGLKSQGAGGGGVFGAERSNQLLNTEARCGEQRCSLGALGIQASQESNRPAGHDTRRNRDQAVVGGQNPGGRIPLGRVRARFAILWMSIDYLCAPLFVVLIRIL